jgi:hypothetical protein
MSRDAPSIGEDLGFVVEMRGLLARDVPLVFGFDLLTTVSSWVDDCALRLPSASD